MFASSFFDERMTRMMEQCAEQAFSTCTTEWLDDEHQDDGVYMRQAVLMQTVHGLAILPFAEGWVGGEANRGEIATFMLNSAEKMLRLYKGFVKHEHLSAYSSRVPGRLYAGSILFPISLPFFANKVGLYLIVSASGLPELADEAGLIRYAENLMKLLGLGITTESLEDILKVSVNPIYQGEIRLAK